MMLMSVYSASRLLQDSLTLLLLLHMPSALLIRGLPEVDASLGQVVLEGPAAGAAGSAAGGPACTVPWAGTAPAMSMAVRLKGMDELRAEVSGTSGCTTLRGEGGGGGGVRRQQAG